MQSSTAQITSRSSSRIVVGLPIHSADIFPALISSPASASRRRISVDFQMPRSAAFIRRFQRTAHLPSRCPSRAAVRSLAAAHACSMWSDWTWMYRVVVESQEWPSSSWIALRSMPRAYSDEAQ